MLSNFLIAASLLISAVQPALGEPISLPRASLNLLSKRQAGGIDNDIPAQCTTTCQPVVDAVNNPACSNGNPVACLCTNTLANAFQACLNCAVVNDPADVTQDLADADIQALTAGCSAAGTPVTISGSSSSSSSSSPAAGSSSTSSPASPATTPAQAGGGSTETTNTPGGGSVTNTPAAVGGGAGTTTTNAAAATTTGPASSAMSLSAHLLAVFGAVLAGASLYAL